MEGAMECPACHRTLRSKSAGGVTADVCSNGCGGVWFDQGEFRKFDEPNEVAGEAFLNIPRDPDVRVDTSRRYRCTKCPDSVLMRHFSSARQTVVVDECPTCAGMWLDFGELGQIRSEYPTEEARRQAAQAHLKLMLGDELDARRAGNRERMEMAQRLSNILMTPWPLW
jgi:Zn-finger nucleic acid-binding protein